MSSSIDTIRQEYAASLVQKLEQLTQTWDGYVAKSATLKELYTEVHRLSGSAGMYGYETLHKHAMVMDKTLRQAQDQPEDSDQVMNMDELSGQWAALSAQMQIEIDKL